MKILSIDPATSSGYSIFEDNKLVRYGFAKSNEKDLGYKLKQTYDFFCSLIDEEKPDIVVFEDFKVSKMVSAAESSYGFRAILRLLCVQKRKEYHVINVSDWKKFITGTTQANKQQKKEFGKDANKIVVRNSLHKLGITWDDTCVNGISGRESKTPYDVTDSIAIGFFFVNK